MNLFRKRQVAASLFTFLLGGFSASPLAHAQDSGKGEKASAFAWVNPMPGKYHESVLHRTFRSPSLETEVGYCVLLPPDYEQDKLQRFPVVYYLHGGRPGSETKAIGLATHLHGMMEQGRVAPMIYVFVNGGPVSHYNMPGRADAQGADVFIKELIPHVDKIYRTVANRGGRGLEGFSQGGRGTMRLSLRYPDLFCSAAAGGGGYETEKKISESGGYENDNLKFAEGDNVWDLARRYAENDAGPKLNLMIYVGTKGFNYQNNLQYMDFLDSLSIPYQRLVVPDVPHSGIEIYKKKCLEIMNFHWTNFKDSSDSS